MGSQKPNRLVVVDETGRVYDRNGLEIELAYQDDGLTLKVFANALEGEDKEVADAVYAERLKQSFAAIPNVLELARKYGLTGEGES